MYISAQIKEQKAFIPEVRTLEEDCHTMSGLIHAIRSRQLCLQYQPRYNSKSGDFIMLEALVRWQHPVKGMLQPDSFISIVESNGLICSLGLWVFEQSCQDLILLRKKLDHQVRIAVNVSLLQCETPYHAIKMQEICKKYHLELSDFEFELTESEQITDINQVVNFCHTLVSMGAEISLDDFGTKYSPFNNLCDLPIKCIKIDQRFTRKIGQQKVGLGGRSEILIKHLVQLAHEMEITVVAEGIETARQLEILMHMGCDQLQGFYLCKPLHVASITSRHIKEPLILLNNQ